MIMIARNYTRSANVVTHTAPHHGDEIFSTGMLALLFDLVMYLTRDVEFINVIANLRNVIVYDVGNVFDPDKKRFDHHQKGFSECRPDGTVYSSAGLIWQHYGEDIVKKLGGPEIDETAAKVIAANVDDILVKGIDAFDNGHRDDHGFMSVSAAVELFNPSWNEGTDKEAAFLEACGVAEKILRRTIETTIAVYLGREPVEKAIETADSPVLVIDKNIDGWRETVLASENPKAKNLLYGVFLADDGSKWNVQAIPPSLDNMTGQRKPFPEAWRGLRDTGLAEVTGVDSAIFCHNNGFFASAKTKEGAIELAKKAAES